MSKHSDQLRREYQSLGTSYPGDAAAARQQLKLARECKRRAYALDPSLKSGMALDAAPRREKSPMALDEATENAIIERAIRTARKLNQSAKRKVTTMPRSSKAFDVDALLQRDPLAPRDRGPDFARAFESRFARRQKPRQSQYAMDESEGEASLRKALEHVAKVEDGKGEPDIERLREHLDNARAQAPEEAEPHLRKATAHINSVSDGHEFDPERLRGYLEAAMEAMQEGNAEDISPVEAERETYLEQGYTDADFAGRDDEPRGPDHREDFDPVSGYGARGPGALLTGGKGENASRGGASWRGRTGDAPTVSRKGSGDKSRGGASWRAHDEAMAGDFDADSLFQK